MLETVLSLSAVLISLITAYFVYRQTKYSKEHVEAMWKEFRDDHEYKRRQYAVNLARDWDDSVFYSRSVILRIFPDRFDKISAISWDDIKICRDKQLLLLDKEHGDNQLSIGNTEYLLVTDHIAKILNYFEIVAHAVFSKSADEETLESYFRNSFFNWYNFLSEYREQLKLQRKHDPWSPVSLLYKRWYPEKCSGERPKTG